MTKSVTLNNVKTIGDFAFANCIGLSEINLSNIETIGEGAFYNTSLTLVTLPANCKYRSDSFPEGCTVTGGILID